ncbi:MAG: PQQ-binding-like beta-propeller repeat protein [Candidatus Methanoperedens sp.]|nr:PQQ-binding-like beta-propeller repeat protein [Candidatus Methanoperedens sp.]MCZ7370685.1 PQQ-binding-like beta-propeller repeat protein [Candidatus Methanoperedens sp.]
MKLIAYLFSLLILAAPAVASDWSQFGYDSSHSGFTTDSVVPPLVLKWTANLYYNTDSSPVVVNGVVYVGSNGGVHALDAESGKEIWRSPTDGFIGAVPMVMDGTLYVGGNDEHFYAIDIKDGSKKWIYKDATGGFVSSATAADNLIYVASEDGSLYVFNPQVGEPSWTKLTGKSIDSSPAVSNNTVYFGNDNGAFFALDAGNGREMWHYYTDIGMIKSSPAAANGILFFGSNNGNVYALTDKGALKWKFSTGSDVVSSPSVKDGTVFVGSKDFNFYAIDSATGNMKWKFQTAGFVDASSAISNDVIYFGSKNNFIYALDTNTGNLLWKNLTGMDTTDYITSPAISGNMLYAVTHSGKVYAYSIAGEVQTTPAITQTIKATTISPTPTPVQTPAVTTPQKTPGFEYAALILLIAAIVRKRINSK